MFESDWKYWKKSDPEFEREIKSFLEHIGSCIHDFSLRVLPDPEPVRSNDGSDHPSSTVSFLENRSWPSGSLHVSHHTDDGLTDAVLKKSRDHTHRDKVTDFQRLQAWCESVQDPEEQTYSNLSSSVPTPRDIPDESDRSKAEMTPRKKGKKEDREPLREDIKNRMLLPGTKERRFVPETALKEIFSKENIAKTLRRHESSLETEIPKLVSFVYDKAIRIFAILVWSEAVKLIDQFYQHQFKDESLPVHCETDDDDNVKAFSCRPDGEVLIENHPFDDDEWTERTLEHFCKDDQWCFLSPIFEENRFRYDFHESTHLPFVDKNPASQKESLFSVVREWRIHRDHLRSSRYVVRRPFPVIPLSTNNQMLQNDLN
jgi:hypothetical protein